MASRSDSCSTFLPCGVNGRCPLAWAALPSADDLLDLLARRLLGDPERLQRLGCHPAVLADEAEQNVLGPDVFVVKHPGRFLGDTTTRRDLSVNLSNIARPAFHWTGLFGLADTNTIHLVQVEADTDDASARAELGSAPRPDEPFVIVYTSGTTSRPKGCVHTFNTYCAGARALVQPFGYTEADVQFGPSPIAHTTGLVTSVLVPLLAGASTHVMAKWDPARAIDEIQRFGCTAAVTAPTFLHNPDVRVRRRAARPVHVATLDMRGRTHPRGGRQAGRRNAAQRQGAQSRRAQRKPGHHNVFSHRRRVAGPDLGRQSGARVKVRIVDDNGSEVPHGTEGDIAYRGPAHMIEYLANPEETAVLFTKDGFSKSGDLGTMTEDGYVRVTGRTKDIVIRGGMNISVREIEEHLAHHPALKAPVRGHARRAAR